MKDVASQELCKELFKLSEWNCQEWWKKGSEVNGGNYTSYYDGNTHTRRFAICPAYDLGYLLRKLPRRFSVKGIEYTLRMPSPFDDWRFDYWSDVKKQRPFDDGTGDNLITVADTPEDAACKMAIKLFKQGILTQEPTNA